jgi:hypothetical protein
MIDNDRKFKMIPAVKGYKQHIFSGPQTGLGFYIVGKNMILINEQTTGFSWQIPGGDELGKLK